MVPLFLAASIAAATPDLIKPVTPWNVDYGTSSCIASREYQTGATTTTLAFRPSPLGSTTQIFLLRAGGHMDAVQKAVEIASADHVINASMLEYGIGKPSQHTSMITLTKEQFAGVGAGDVFSIRRKGEVVQRFAVQRFAAVKAELGKCLADLDRYWAMSAAQKDRIKSPAKPITSYRSLFSSEDYPRQALDERNTGTVGARIMIDESGKVRDCSPIETSGSAVLDTMVCVVLTTRARYSPAVDVDGKAVRSFDDIRIRWLLPG